MYYCTISGLSIVFCFDNWTKSSSFLCYLIDTFVNTNQILLSMLKCGGGYLSILIGGNCNDILFFMLLHIILKILFSLFSSSSEKTFIILLSGVQFSHISIHCSIYLQKNNSAPVSLCEKVRLMLVNSCTNIILWIDKHMIIKANWA